MQTESQAKFALAMRLDSLVKLFMEPLLLALGLIPAKDLWFLWSG